MKGGKSGKTVQPRDPLNSELIKRVLLDIHEEKHMPPRGKKQPKEEEIRLLYWWIQNGASEIKTIAEVNKNDTIKLFFSKQKNTATPSIDLPVIKKVDSMLLARFNASGLKAMPISIESPYLEVSAISFPNLEKEQLKNIIPIAANIAWLNLSNTKITNEAFQSIGKCVHLKKLSISNTNISNAAIPEIGKLVNLVYLNIVGTQIDNTGLQKICENKQLRKIYCWNSKITQEGIEVCKKLNPSIEIDNGGPVK